MWFWPHPAQEAQHRNHLQAFFADTSPLQNSRSCSGEQGGQWFQFLIELCLNVTLQKRVERSRPGAAILRKTCWPRWPSAGIWEHGFPPYPMGMAHCISRVFTDNVIYAKRLLPFMEPGILACSGPTTWPAPVKSLGTECLSISGGQHAHMGHNCLLEKWSLSWETSQGEDSEKPAFGFLQTLCRVPFTLADFPLSPFPVLNLTCKYDFTLSPQKSKSESVKPGDP